MPRWQARVDDLLFEGEAVRESLDIGSSRVVVTSHRILVFTPELKGENFRKADRPNVTGVDTGALGKSSFLRRGLSLGVVGLVLLVAGLVFDPSSLFSDDLDVDSGAASDVGFGGIVEMTQSLFSLLLNLDVVLRTLGALALLLATVLLAVYWYFRTPTLVIRQAGDDEDLHIERPNTAGETASRLERAILPDPSERGALGGTPSDGSLPPDTPADGSLPGDGSSNRSLPDEDAPDGSLPAGDADSGDSFVEDTLGRPDGSTDEQDR
jgi:hypothetical protein